MTDIEIEENVVKKDIRDIAKKINLGEENLILYGNDKAKITLDKGNKNGKLILVTAINPTPYGEGKTTVSIGLNDGLNLLGKNSIASLREPSMGPVFGMKGGATGGGYSQVMPSTDINLHFTGDFHAITSVVNLLAAAMDNHIHFGNALKIKKVYFSRCLDVNDRALRTIQLDGRVEHFDITAASEVMAIFTLATDLNDLEKRLGNIVIGINENNENVYARDLNITGALTVLLKTAFYPNLVQTLENNPVIIHGGPFANIAHGCSSIKSTKLALSLADYVITEAGFGSDLGAEKFFDIKCRNANIKPDCVVLVATIKALKYNDIEKNNNLEKGLSNLQAHIDMLKKSNSNIVVCLNKYDTDTIEEINVVKQYVENQGLPFTVSSAYKDGGKGAINLAKEVLKVLENENNFNYLYDINLHIKEKISILADKIYNASDVQYTEEANKKIDLLENSNLYKVPICVAKTQYSISDNKEMVGYPKGHTIHVRDVKLYGGANFIVIYLGTILTMPGLPKLPNYEQIKIDNEGNITGII